MSQDNPFNQGNPFSDKPPEKPNPYATGFGGIDKGTTPRGPVKNYLVESILCLIFCGGVFAIPAIIYACQVNPKLNSGDYHGAVHSSEQAKRWCIIAVCIGLVCTGISIAAQVALFSAGGAM